MKTLKSVLAMVVALCLMMCLAVPAMATNDPTESSTEASTGASTENTEAPTGDAATDEKDEAPTGETESGETTGESETTPTENTDSHEGHDHTNPGKTEDPNKVIRTVLLILEVIASIALIVVVLLQSGKESGLGNTISGNSDSYMNKNKKGGLDKALASATKWVALAWIVITLVLGFV